MRNEKIVKIGVFDSGAGGKLIADKLARLKNVKIIYLSDPEYFPYGNKTSTVIRGRLLHFAGQFKLKGCRIVVIACNSATTNGISFLRQKFPDITFIGIEPPVKPVAVMTKSKKAAIIGTPATITSSRLKELEGLSKGVKFYNIACPGLAEYIEKRSRYNDLEAESLIKKFLNKPISDGADIVGIACTHYPYLLPLMQKIYPQIKFYDPTDAVMARVEKAIITA